MSLALNPCLETAVMINIVNLKRMGYIPDSVFNEALATADIIANEGDTLLYGGNPGDAARIFNKTAMAIAVLSFQPGGFRGFGMSIESLW